MRLRHVYSVLVAGLPSGALALGVPVPGLAQGLGVEGGRPFGPWLWGAGLFLLLRILLVTGLLLARGGISEDEYRKLAARLA